VGNVVQAGWRTACALHPALKAVAQSRQIMHAIYVK
jgi:hypothetical protein